MAAVQKLKESVVLKVVESLIGPVFECGALRFDAMLADWVKLDSPENILQLVRNEVLFDQGHVAYHKGNGIGGVFFGFKNIRKIQDDSMPIRVGDKISGWLPANLFQPKDTLRFTYEGFLPFHEEVSEQAKALRNKVYKKGPGSDIFCFLTKL